MGSNYTPTIGLEIHAELATKTKMFCDSLNDPDEERPNVNVCPVCMGHPGTLPVVNKEAVRSIVRTGYAVGGRVADFTEFDRKNYFYPDIPKGYQISQYKHPIVHGGTLRGVSITRVHLEEDTARSTHNGDASLLDFNRAGVPLMELVTEPVLHSAKESVGFARELQLLLRTLGVARANMEKGEMRVEANVSVLKGRDFDLDQPKGLGGRTGVSNTPVLGTKVEVKNLNSFRSVERAIEYEIRRQIDLLEVGGEVSQETRGWDDSKGKTYSQRSKESSHDYRYFPDPDIPKYFLSEIAEFGERTVRSELPELPADKRRRLSNTFGLKVADVEMFVADPVLSSEFERAMGEFKKKVPKKARHLAILAANYLVSDFVGIQNANSGARVPSDFSELIMMVEKGEVSSRGAKDILAIASLPGESRRVRDIATAEGILQNSNEVALQALVEDVINEHLSVVAEYKAGKTSSLQFLIGQGMKKSRGSANPALLRELLEKVISKEE